MHNVTIFDVSLSTNKIKPVPFKTKMTGTHVSLNHFCYSQDDPELDVKRTFRTNVIIRDAKGKFVSWKKLGPKMDLSEVAAFPPKEVH